MDDATTELNSPFAKDEAPNRIYWVVAWTLFFWGIGYSLLIAEAFFLFDPEDFDRLVTAGMILPGYSDYVQHLPPWVIAISFFKAITRLGGAVGLLLRKSFAVSMYSLSFAVSCVIFFRGFLLENVASVESPSQIGLEALFFGMSIFAVWWAFRALLRGILK